MTRPTDRRMALRLLAAPATAALPPLIAAPALMTVARPTLAQAKRKISYAYLLDPAYDAVTWAMRTGRIASRSIEVEARGIAIPQLIQATAARQYDAIMTAVIALPAAEKRGLKLRVLATALQAAEAGEGGGVWVAKDSPIRSAADLKGKTLGSYALRSTGYTQVRIALAGKHRLNMALEGGDLRQVEIQAPNLPGALSSGQIDAATLIHAQAFKAMQAGDFRVVAETARDNIETYRMRFISALNVSYPEKLEKDPDAFAEFSRLFKASSDYVLAHPDEVFAAVAAQSRIDPAFFRWWFEKSSVVPGVFTETHAQTIMKFFELSRELGMLKDFPDIRTLVWDRAPKA
ncbi:MAG: ABC transporter substrate-binding protein [Lautropia sp.]